MVSYRFDTFTCFHFETSSRAINFHGYADDAQINVAASHDDLLSIPGFTHFLIILSLSLFPYPFPSLYMTGLVIHLEGRLCRGHQVLL